MAFTKQLRLTKDIFKEVYGFSNSSDFYKNDLETIKHMREKVSQITFAGINKPLAKDALLKYLDNIIKRLEK